MKKLIMLTAVLPVLLLVTFLIPASAIFLGTVFLSESLDPRHFLGMACIGLGLASIDGRLWMSIRNLLKSTPTKGPAAKARANQRAGKAGIYEG